MGFNANLALNEAIRKGESSRLSHWACHPHMPSICTIFALAGAGAIVLGALAHNHLPPFEHLQSKQIFIAKVALLSGGGAICMTAMVAGLILVREYETLSQKGERLNSNLNARHKLKMGTAYRDIPDRHVVADKIVMDDSGITIYYGFIVKPFFADHDKSVLKSAIFREINQIFDQHRPVTKASLMSLENSTDVYFYPKKHWPYGPQKIIDALRKYGTDMQVVISDKERFLCLNYGDLIASVESEGEIHYLSEPQSDNNIFKKYRDNGLGRFFTVKEEKTFRYEDYPSKVHLCGNRSQVGCSFSTFCPLAPPLEKRKDPQPHIPLDCMARIFKFAGCELNGAKGWKNLRRLAGVSKFWRETALLFCRYREMDQMCRAQLSKAQFSLPVSSIRKVEVCESPDYLRVTDSSYGLFAIEVPRLTELGAGPQIFFSGNNPISINVGSFSIEEQAEGLMLINGGSVKKIVDSDWLATSWRVAPAESRVIQLHDDKLLLCCKDMKSRRHTNDRTMVWIDLRHHQLQEFSRCKWDAVLFGRFLLHPEGGFTHVPSRTFLRQEDKSFLLSDKRLAYKISTQTAITFPLADFYAKESN